MSHTEHRESASDAAVRCVVITCSDTRTPETDASGDLIAELLQRDGHVVLRRRLVRENPGEVAAATYEACDFAQAVILTGGTGLSSRDGTVEAVEPLLDHTLPGFGELFRMLSYDEIGAASMLSRSLAGVRGKTILFALPGSKGAVGLAMEKLILPELRHIVRELSR